MICLNKALRAGVFLSGLFFRIYLCERQSQTEIFHLLSHSPKWLQQPGLGQAIARSQGLQPRLECLGWFSLHFVGHEQGAGWV